MKILAIIMLAFLIEATRPAAAEETPATSPSSAVMQAQEAMARRRIRHFREYLSRDTHRHLRPLAVRLLRETADILSADEGQPAIHLEVERCTVQVATTWNGAFLASVSVTDAHDPAVPALMQDYQVAFVDDETEKAFRDALSPDHPGDVVLQLDVVRRSGFGVTTLLVVRVVATGA